MVSISVHGWHGDKLRTRTILAHLQVVRKVDSVFNDVVRPSSEVHVTNGAFGEHETRQHLRQVVRSNTVTVTRVKNGALK